MDERNWDSGGITNVPGLSALQTQDTYTHKCKQTYINKPRDSHALGEAYFQSAFKRWCAKSSCVTLRFGKNDSICINVLTQGPIQW